MQLVKQFKDKFPIVTYFRTVVCFSVLDFFFFFACFWFLLCLFFNILRSITLFENLMT